MDMQTTKIELVKHLLNVKKESVLNKIKDILLNNEEPEIVAHSIKGEPLTKTQYIQQIKDAESRIDKGQHTTHKDLLNEVENW